MAHIKPALRVVPPIPSEHHSIAGSTLFVMAATLASTILGFFREVVNARFYGTHWEMDTFLAAATIPTILFGVFNGALVSALVPTFSDYISTGREEDAWKLGSTIINLLGIILTACALIGWIAAPFYVPLIAGGFHGNQLSVAIDMTRDLMPSIVAVSLSGVLSSMLNAYRKFRAAAMIGIASNVVTVGSVMIFNSKFGIYALVFGTLCGLIAQLLVQVPAFVAIGRYRLTIDIHHPGLRKMWSLLGPIIVGSIAGQLALLFDRFFASHLATGYIAGMNYVVKLVSFPQQIFAAAIATVIFPLLAAQFARNNRSGVADSALTGLRLVLFIAIPSVCALIALAYPMVQTLFERGTFGTEATALTASLMPFSAIGLVALSANVVLTRCCFACQETRFPVAISILTVITNILLSLLWLPTLGARGLLLANSLSQTMQAIMLLVLVTRLVGTFDWKPLRSSALRVTVASLAMYAALSWIHTLAAKPESSFIWRASFLFGQIAIGGAVFVAMARILRLEELDMAWRAIVMKFERNLQSAPDNSEAPIG
jgi:putative peptidoglycan lipid II flippase